MTPSVSSKWGSFKSTLNGITSDFVYGNYHKLSVVRGWVDDIYMFMPKVTIFNNQYPNKEIMNKLYDLPADQIYGFLKGQTNKYVYEPIRKKIEPKDPRIAYFVWGTSTIKFDKERPYIMGVKEYGRSSSKTVRFDTSFGFSLNNMSVTGFLPSVFNIKEIDTFAAANYGGKWKGVRFVQ